MTLNTDDGQRPKKDNFVFLNISFSGKPLIFILLLWIRVGDIFYLKIDSTISFVYKKRMNECVNLSGLVENRTSER